MQQRGTDRFPSALLCASAHRENCCKEALFFRENAHLKWMEKMWYYNIIERSEVPTRQQRTGHDMEGV